MTNFHKIEPTITKRTALTATLILLGLIVFGVRFMPWASAENMPFDRSHRIIITNDAGTHDVFQAEFALSLASRGDINLVGIVAEKVWRGNSYEDFVNDAYGDLIEMAGRSGMVNLPEIKEGFLRGDTWTLEMPSSKKIEDTKPIISEGASFIKEEVLKSNPDKPLIICTGGSVSSVASAYLLALQQGKGQQFIDRVIVSTNLAIVEGNNLPLKGFNLYVDQWAGYIVFKKLRNVLADLRQMGGCGFIDKSELQNSMPNTEMARFILDKDLTNEVLPGNIIGDAAPLLLVLYPKRGTYYTSTKRLVVTDEWKDIAPEPWFPTGRIDSPVIMEERSGNILLVTGCRSKVGSEHFFDVLSDPDTYQGIIIQQAPYNGLPVDLNGRIELEAFDFGQEGYAYHDEAFSSIRSESASKFRMLERPDLEATDDPLGGELHLAYLGNGEWLEYAVEAKKSSYYSAIARVSSVNNTGGFYLEFRDPDSDEIKAYTKKVNVPHTGGFNKWINLDIPKFYLPKGHYVLRFVNTTEILRLEVENLKFTASAAVETVHDSSASKGIGQLLKAKKRKDYIEYGLSVQAGLHKIVVGYMAGVDHGLARMKINGTVHVNSAGRPFIVDQYPWKQGWRTFEYGVYNFLENEKVILRFESIAKNKLSKGWNLGFDFIELQPEGPYKINYFDFFINEEDVSN